MIQKLLNYIKAKIDARTNPQAALSVFDKSLKKLDKIDKRIVKKQDRLADAASNANAECDALRELYEEQERKARQRKVEATKARDIKVSEVWDKSIALELKLVDSEKLRNKLNELNSV